MTAFDDYVADGEHTHAQSVPFIVWALLVCVIVLAMSLGGLAVYLTGRVVIGDRRNAITEGQTLALRHAVCTVLNPIRPGQVRGVDQARALPFPTSRGKEPLCSTLPTSKPTRTPSATASSPVAATAQPAPASVRTVTVTPTRSSNRPSPRPTPSGTLSPTARPTPTPSRTCIAVICLR